MKDVISILQGRIAKRENLITCWLKKGDSSLILQEMVVRQKQDKRILAEIVRLRRELKERDVILDRFYRAEEI